ncbi:hypothetical protein PT974_03279 [Cladobotryum mycophilum]|uniref:Uncharacterized protein n=1 Tax=Cladobotryum mycophilum TaxID=491253 RepID=A0ABR0SSH8_9HYPO
MDSSLASPPSLEKKQPDTSAPLQPSLQKPATIYTSKIHHYDGTMDNNARTPFLPDGENIEPTANRVAPINHDPPPPYEEPRLSSGSGILCFLAFWGYVALGWNFFHMVFPAHSSTNINYSHSLRSLRDCGPTKQDALHRSCAYDSLSASWLPPYCRDEPLTAEFERAAHWQYFADENGTVPLTRTDVAELGGTGGSF